VKHVSIAKPATSEEENLPGCSGSNGFDMTGGSDVATAGLMTAAGSCGLDLGDVELDREVCGDTERDVAMRIDLLGGTDDEAQKRCRRQDHHIMTNTSAEEKSQQEWSLCE
jgi:hypothetical protein